MCEAPKEKSPMDYRYDTVCGLYCGACDVLLANEKHEVASLAKAWDMKPEYYYFILYLYLFVVQRIRGISLNPSSLIK
jgi:hypothetical protein